MNIWRNKVFFFFFYQDFIKGWESRVPVCVKQCEVVAGQGGQWLVGGAWGAAPDAMKCDQISKAFTVAADLYICIRRVRVWGSGVWAVQFGMF